MKMFPYLIGVMRLDARILDRIAQRKIHLGVQSLASCLVLSCEKQVQGNN